MIMSMTGFGRASETVGGREISVELRCVNHRYFEFSSRISRAYSFVESRLKAYIQNAVSRGKLEVSLTIKDTGSSSAAVSVNLELAKGYANALSLIASELGIKNDVNAATIARFPDVFVMNDEEPDEEEIWNEVRTVLDKALDSFSSMRHAEGERLLSDMLTKIDNLESMLTQIEKNSENSIEKYRDKLFARMKTVLEDKAIDENRILLEAAIYADKSAIDEETVRLRSHFEQFKTIVASDGAIGRKLDFLVQEMNREVNTICSKSDNFDTATLVEMKAEIEKIREQIQNIE